MPDFDRKFSQQHSVGSTPGPLRREEATHPAPSRVTAHAIDPTRLPRYFLRSAATAVMSSKAPATPNIHDLQPPEAIFIYYFRLQLGLDSAAAAIGSYRRDVRTAN